MSAPHEWHVCVVVEGMGRAAGGCEIVVVTEDMSLLRWVGMVAVDLG